MKGSNPVITLLGNNSGRNLGDAAILASILDNVSGEIPDAEFLVPSIAPKFIDQHYGSKYRVKGINVLPWTGSIRLLGIPTLRCLMKSDVALICDGIIFGHKLFSPHNFLITLIFLVPWAKLFGCKIVCYSCGIGPFPSKLSERFARWVINGSDSVSMRDRDNFKLAQKIGVTVPVEVTGDPAFVNKVADEKRFQELASIEKLDTQKPWLGLNVTPYIDSWLKKDERISDRSKFLDVLAEGINSAKEELSASGEEVLPVIFSCSPMDEAYSEELVAKIGGRVIGNSTYLSHDIQALMRNCQLLLGMRFHSLVLSSAVKVPIVGLVYAPKVRGFMRLIGSEILSLELASLNPERLSKVITSSWSARSEIRKKQQVLIEELTEGARNASKKLRLQFFANYTPSASRSSSDFSNEQSEQEANVASG